MSTFGWIRPIGLVVLAAALLVSDVGRGVAGDLSRLSNGELASAIDAAQLAGRKGDPARASEANRRTQQLLNEALLRGGRKPIYGTDDRQDWNEFRFDPGIRTQAAASIAMFRLDDVVMASTKRVTVRKQAFGDKLALCQGEAFVNQPASAHCSGVLIAPDVMLTAGHCIQDDRGGEPDVAKMRDVVLVFGFVVDDANPDGRTEFGSEQVYHAKEIVARSLHSASGADWAVVRLDRRVPDAIAKPVAMNRAGQVKAGQSVYVIGYPVGLPVKYAPGATVRDATPAQYFVANLDTFGGNSGSGVYSTDRRELIGLLVRGDADFVPDNAKGCRRTFVCPTTGCGGEHVMRLNKIDLRKVAP